MRFDTRALLLPILVLCASMGGRLCRAEHFDTQVTVQTESSRADAFMDTTPPLGGVNKRPIVTVKLNETVRISWHMKSAFPHGVMKGVTIHFFIVREDRIGQKLVPDPAGKAGIVDNQFQMDFAPHANSSGSLKMKLSETGNYLVRVQSEDTHQEHDHEHFSAIDLKVQ